MKKACIVPKLTTSSDTAAAGQYLGDPASAAARSSFVFRHSFVVRIWRGEGDAGWRGWVEDTRTGEACFVQERDRLLAFIERRTGSLDP
jgi:hypothetical protein